MRWRASVGIPDHRGGRRHPQRRLAEACGRDRRRRLDGLILGGERALAQVDAQAGPAPILLRVDTQAGHGLGCSVGQKVEQNADILALSLRVSLVEPPPPAAR